MFTKDKMLFFLSTNTAVVNKLMLRPRLLLKASYDRKPIELQ